MSTVWSDDTTGAAVHVNGGLVEITLPDGWSGRLLPEEATALAAALSTAVAEAGELAARWDRHTRTYTPPSTDPAPV